MPVGRLKWFDPKRHFGFLIHDEGGQIFFHESDVSEIDRPLNSGDRVIFRIEEGPRGPIARRLFCVRRGHELDGSKVAG